MRRKDALRTSILALAGVVGMMSMTACSGSQESPAPAQREAATTTQPAEPAPAPPPSEPAPAVPTTQAEAPPPAAPPEPSAPAAPEPPATEAAAPAAAQVVEVPATKPGLTRVGADKCKMCHKVEYESWAASAHATSTPKLDCESCHGPGSEYKTMAIMKDPDKAKAAGLVIPGKSFCTASCHAKDWKDDMLERAHAHKGGAGQG